jgi:hypothetical protein
MIAACLHAGATPMVRLPDAQEWHIQHATATRSPFPCKVCQLRLSQFWGSVQIWNGLNWTQFHPATVPPNQYAAGMDYDPVNKVIVMFGGYSSTVVRSATWLLTLVP